MSACSCFRGPALLCSVHDDEAIRLLGELADMLRPPAEPAAPEPVEVAAAELAAAWDIVMAHMTCTTEPYDALSTAFGKVIAEYDRRRTKLAAMERARDAAIQTAQEAYYDRDEVKAERDEARAERDRLHAFLLEATGTLPFHGFANDELGDPWVQWVERVAAYLTETC